MITGTVTADYEPRIQISVRSSAGKDHLIDAVVDTGFTGWLTLPPATIAALNLAWREWGAAILADGSKVYFNVYDATVIWDGTPIPILVDEADSDPLIGMKQMMGFRITIDDIDGGPVGISRL